MLAKKVEKKLDFVADLLVVVLVAEVQMDSLEPAVVEPCDQDSLVVVVDIHVAFPS